ncbi:MAG TPA: SDR family oxidoreductase [Ignavibacteriaceae bacterium]|nr:SDR family oxidoreductase [Ignavibacteriaceae bacterium]
MKLLIIGATGGTGRELVKQALELGHKITILVRNSEKVLTVHPSLQVINGNVLNIKEVEQAVSGQDAVISSLGHKRFFIKTNILSEGTKNIIASMEKQNVKRFICITTLGINDSRFRLGLYYTLFTIPIILFFYFRDKSKQEKLIMNSKLDWTIVRPGQLTNSKLTGEYQVGNNVGNYFITKTISRANVAHFILSQLCDKTFFHKKVGIVNR